MADSSAGWLIVVWWVFFSRAPWSERLGAIVLMIVALFATSRLVHESIANGMMGMMFSVYAIPVLSLALVAWAVASRRLSRRTSARVDGRAILLACGVLTLVRTGGITGDADSDFALAVDADSRGTAPGPGRRRADGAPAGSGSSGDS